jgi:hypothetical protein
MKQQKHAYSGWMSQPITTAGTIERKSVQVKDASVAPAANGLFQLK